MELPAETSMEHHRGVALVQLVIQVAHWSGTSFKAVGIHTVVILQVETTHPRGMYPLGMWVCVIITVAGALQGMYGFFFI